MNLITGIGTYNISADRYNVTILGINGQEQNINIFGTNFNICVSCSFSRLIDLYNSTGGNVTVDLFSNSYFPNLMAVESGPSRVVLHGENKGSINAGFPSGTEVVTLNSETPGSRIRRLPKDAEVVFLRVAPVAVILFYDAEHVFKAHDGDGLDITLLA